MENQEIGGLGGKRGKGKDDDDKKKDKQDDRPLREDEKPRNRRYTEEEKGKKVKVPSFEDELPSHWDWSDFQGIISNVLDQKLQAICWAITLIRAIEALLNINVPVENQITLSIQHLRNVVEYGKSGLLDDQHADNHLRSYGALHEGECSYAGSKTICHHNDNVERVRIDGIVRITNVDDMELREIVRRQPVVGILPLRTSLQRYKHGIYKGDGFVSPDVLKHAVLIVGYGIDDYGNAYWIIQNTWGTKWGKKGFGYVYRHMKRGEGSMFLMVKYPVKAGYPKENKKKKK